ncbi:hypothetical protein [Methylobacterium oryzihabitans]|uniref:Uncharacterized protein n=1 Tax=Methylobacterium oryzihabitans TaxID=2499852 RepID=A0A3S2VAZ2_9HYPH|nr:hypothetical protein [Methylobacterium oryzihabitans]RVU18414.1 hypothetical protein EOE48_11010 [Methylobacterium oryzihabitans]
MNDDTPKEVAWHFGIATALSVSLCAAPFVPEAILAYAGYRFLRHFTYGWRNWRAPGRVPHHLGRRGYRDETTRRRGDATWPIGLAKTGQVWLRREDLVQGVAIEGDDPQWQTLAINNLVFGACINRMGAIVVQGIVRPVPEDDANPDDQEADEKEEMLAQKFAELARPFGRDNEVYSIDLDAVPRPPLRITASTLAAAIADMRLGPEAETLHGALMPFIEMVAQRRKKNPLELYAAFVDAVALDRLVAGKYEIDLHEVSADEITSADGAALQAAIDPIRAIPKTIRETGRIALAAHASEIAGLKSVSLTEGLELCSAISARGIVCIRPSSPLTTALVIARCVEALMDGKPGHAADNLIHVVYHEELSGTLARRFRAAAVRAGAIGSLSLTARPPGHIHKATRKITAVRIQGSAWNPEGAIGTAKVISTIKDCSFTLDIEMPA